MRDTTKLLPVLLLGSALGGCSMAGTGDYMADYYGQGEQSQYWGETGSSCQQIQQPQQQFAGCEQAFAPVQQAVAQNPCSAPVAAQSPYGCAQAAPQYQGYQGQPSYAVQPGYAEQFGYAGQQEFMGQPAYTGQQAYQQNAYAPAYVPPYAGARGGSSRGLRQAYTYGSVGGVLYDVDSDLYGIQGRLGYQSSSFFGAEVEGSFGVSDDEGTVDFGGTPLQSEIEIDTQIAAFAVARYPVSHKLNLLGRVGYHNTELNAEFDDGVTEFETDFSTDGIAYGVGVEYALGQRTALRADYTVYDFDGPDADAISLAIARKF